MNWWSAWSWCEAVGGELVDITKECAKAGGKCDQIKSPFSTSTGGWTKTMASEKTPLQISPSTGQISNVRQKNQDMGFPFCVLKLF